MYKITIPTKEQIIEIDKKLKGGGTINEVAIDFIISKIKAKKLSENLEKEIVTISSIFWYDIIANYPFVDGNKRTAAETMKFFFELNNFELKSEMNGIIYLSLKISNNDITFNELHN